MLFPVTVPCFVLGKLWTTGYRQVQRLFYRIRRKSNLLDSVYDKRPSITTGNI